MAVISIRLNEEEEKMVNYLSEHFNKDKSALIKHSILEIYEDLYDRDTIEKYEKIEKKKIKFYTSDEMKKKLQ